MSIKQKIAWGLFRLHGWKVQNKTLPVDIYRCVVVVAPHTSNWDFYFGVLCMTGLGVPIKMAIKKFWTKFPFSLIIKPLGGVGIDRSRKKGDNGKSQVELLAEIFENYKRIALIITPEGSRSLRREWKTGFYHVAQKANVPIVTLTGDYPTKTVAFETVYQPTESLEDVMTGLMKSYEHIKGKYPKQFSLDQRYVTS